MNMIERLKELEARLAPEHEDVMLDRAHLRKLLAVAASAKEYVKNTETAAGYTPFDRHEEHLLGKMAVAVADLETEKV